MDRDHRLRELNEIKLALAVLSVQLDALAVRNGRHFPAPPDEPAKRVDQSFALRAVLAMKHRSEHQNE